MNALKRFGRILLISILSSITLSIYFWVLFIGWCLGKNDLCTRAVGLSYSGGPNVAYAFLTVLFWILYALIVVLLIDFIFICMSRPTLAERVSGVTIS